MNLPDCVEQNICFILNFTEQVCVEAHIKKYHWVKSIKTSNIVKLTNLDDLTLLSHRTRALQASCHSLLECVTEVKTEDDNKDELKMSEIAQKDWLKRVKESMNVINSLQIQCFLALYQNLKAKYLTEKVLIWSVYLCFLNIIEIVLDQIECECLQYNSKINQMQCAEIQNKFVNVNDSKLLLLTADTDKIDLNIA